MNTKTGCRKQGNGVAGQCGREKKGRGEGQRLKREQKRSNMLKNWIGEVKVEGRRKRMRER